MTTAGTDVYYKVHLFDKLSINLIIDMWVDAKLLNSDYKNSI